MTAAPDPVNAEDDLVDRPFTYAYRYPAFPPEGATVIRFNHGEEVNGSKPIQTIPLYTAAALEAVRSTRDGEIERLTQEAKHRRNLTRACNECNADDVRFWDAVIKFLGEFQ